MSFDILAQWIPASIQADESVLSMRRFVFRRFLKDLTRFQFVVAEELKCRSDNGFAILGIVQKRILPVLEQFPSTMKDRMYMLPYFEVL